MIPPKGIQHIYYFISHYVNATPIDVLHSPFVFKFYNTCVRRKPGDYAPSERILSILLRAIKYFNYRSGILINHHNSWDSGMIADCLKRNEGQLITMDPSMQSSHDTAPEIKTDVLIIADDAPSEMVSYTIQSILPNMPNGSAVVLFYPYRNRKNRILWSNLKAIPQLNISVDLFFIGFLFVRKEQVRQNFKIRVW